MRIIFVSTAINDARGGGSHKNIVSIIRTLREAGHAVEVHTAFGTRNQPPLDISVIPHQGEGLSFFSFSRLFSQLMQERERDADLFFVYGHTLLWGAGMYRMRGRTPVVVYLDNYLDTMAESMRRGNFLKRWAHLLWERTVGRRYIRAIDRFIAVSAFLQNVYTQAGFPAKRFVVVPNIFFWEEVPAVVRDKKRMLYTGRLTYAKGIDLLLHALKSLHTVPGWSIRIIGEGPLEDTVDAAVRTDSRITHLPWLSTEELVREYASAEIFVHPARWPEPFGRTVVEALHAGLPVIIPRVGASVEIAGEAGVSFENGNAASLVGALKTLLEHPERRAQMAAQAHSKAESFSNTAVAPKLIAALEGLSGSAPRR